MMSLSLRSRRTPALVLGAATMLLAACSSGSTAGTGTDAAAAAGPTDDLAVEALAAAYTGQTGTPPTTPTTPPADVTVWVVSCGQQIPACSTPAAAVEEAAGVIGWDSNTCDGQLNPDGWGNCIRQAVSGGADVIIPIGIDCASITQPFQEAADAGVLVIGGGGADCDATGGEAIWAAERLQLEGVDAKSFFTGAGALAAKYLIGKTDAQAQVVMLEFEDALWGPWLTEGFETEIATCDACEIVETLPLTNGDIVGGTGVGKFSAALQNAPDANAVWVPIGGWMTSGFAQAVVTSGRSDDLEVVSSFGDASNMGIVAEDQGQDAVLGYNTAWGAWGSIDTAIRVLNGEEPEVQGNGFAIVDADNNMPPAGEDYTGGVDYEAEYQKIWGVS